MKKYLYALVAASIASPALATEFHVVGQSTVGSFTYHKIEWTRADGSTDQGVLKSACSNGAASSWVYAPRDMATGMASGKRMHKPFTIVKEWGAASPALKAAKGNWDLATGKGARSGGGISAMDDWQQVSLTGLAVACSPGGKVSMSDISMTR